jgi:hypothetical protein
VLANGLIGGRHASQQIHMSYNVNVPLDRAVQFPDRCPFSGVSSPRGRLTLRRTSTSMILPIPGIGIFNSYSQTTFRIPARRRIVVLAVALEIAMWLSFLGGFGVCVLLINTAGDKGINPIPPIVGGACLSVFFRVARFLVLRKVRIRNAWGGFVEVLFGSESYAKQLCELNRLAMAFD